MGVLKSPTCELDPHDGSIDYLIMLNVSQLWQRWTLTAYKENARNTVIFAPELLSSSNKFNRCLCVDMFTCACICWKSRKSVHYSFFPLKMVWGTQADNMFKNFVRFLNRYVCGERSLFSASKFIIDRPHWWTTTGRCHIWHIWSDNHLHIRC